MVYAQIKRYSHPVLSEPFSVVGLHQRDDALGLVLSRVPKRDLDTLAKLLSRDDGEGVTDERHDFAREIGLWVRGALARMDRGELEAVERDVGARPGRDIGPEVRPDEAFPR